MRTVIAVRGVSKKYKLFRSRRDRLREALHPFRKAHHDEFWALHDVSLDILEGQTVGLVGRNGSGKSTLLQIITGILQPTRGDVKVAGRVAALLELGAGFNPDHTGRENVVLNGVIMGVPEREMRRRLPMIEEFADIGHFFDQPLRTYSTGMSARLAFAAAINVDPEILLIDEALSVGDARFQNKCFAHFAKLQKAGKTIIIVSHSANAITAHCNRAILIDGGRVVADGHPREVVDQYLQILFPKANEVVRAEAAADAADEGDAAPSSLADADFIAGSTDVCSRRSCYNKYEVRTGTGGATIVDYLIETPAGKDAAHLHVGETLSILCKVCYQRPVGEPSIGFSVRTLDGIYLYSANTFMRGITLPPANAGECRVYNFKFAVNFVPGEYFLDIGVAESDGTEAGIPLDVRRALAHFVVKGDGAQSFHGLVDVSPTFQSS